MTNPLHRPGNRALATLSHVEQQDRALAVFEMANQALAEAVTLVEVLDVHSRAEHLKLLGRQAKDTEIVARAAELRMRSERRLGEMLIEAKERGELDRGGRPRKTPAGGEGVSSGWPGGAAGDDGTERNRITTIALKEAGIDYKLSSRAQKLAGKPAQLFEGVVREAIEKIRAGRAIVIDPLKASTTAEKIVKRAVRQAELAARQKALPEKVYGVIWEDPEWEYETWSEAGKDRHAGNHYSTSPTAEIMKRDVGKIAAPDCVRYVWATVPMLKQALAYIETDGFAYKSHWIWDKVDAGTGHWNRNRHELLLVATRGSVPAPAMGTQLPSIMVERAREHSRKPDWAYEMVEADYPDLPKIELNARRRRPGWDAWGLEAPDNETPPPSEGHEGEEAQERMPASEGRPEGSASPVHRSSGADAQLPDSVHAEPGSSPRAGEEHELQAAAPSAVAAAPAAADDAGGVSSPPSGPPSPASPLHEIAGREPPTPVAGEDAGAAGNELPAPASVSIERAFYDDLVLSARERRGKHTRQSAEAILRAAYACEPIIPTKQLAEDLGHPVGTVLSWASRFGLTKLERRATAGIATRFGGEVHP